MTATDHASSRYVTSCRWTIVRRSGMDSGRWWTRGRMTVAAVMIVASVSAVVVLLVGKAIDGTGGHAAMIAIRTEAIWTGAIRVG